ncbi:MAG: choline dehydrogenase [Hydrotalea sp.]|nr:choline dehydrogenase [Hydrotalea sp.]
MSISAAVTSADFVIIGSGSSGSAMAHRLSEDGHYSVLVLEYGGGDKSVLIQMPSALSYPMNMPKYDWGYKTEAEPFLGGRQLVTPRGKVIGGSSSINGMVFVRGNPMDYEGWKEAGADGWGYADVLPYFKRMEETKDGDDAYRGRHGPLHVQYGRLKNPLYRAFIAAAAEAGYQTTDDYNGYQQEGFGAMEMTVKGGKRWSSATAYLKPALKRKNCRLLKCFVRRIIFDGTKAIGVEVMSRGKIEIIKADREVILAAGSINSPKILLQSGVGPAKELRPLGINVVVDRPGVGKNLQDHLEIYLQAQCKKPITINRKIGLLSKGIIGAEWLFLKSGLGTTNHFESCGFIRSDKGVPYPDIQYHFLPAAIRYDGKAAFPGDGFQVHVGPMLSPSRGEITLRSGDPSAPPKILFNYMSQDYDWQVFRKAIKLTREIFVQPALKDYFDGEVSPGSNYQTDDELNGWLKEHVESAYHPSCSCKMGRATDKMAVVDSDCRVIGTSNLRLADSSIFPRITNGNLNGPSIMTGEKAASHILNKKLPPLNTPFYQHPNWQTAQR